ncbi:MAG: oligosaccharide flippase family protein [Bacteroidota bacterium]
MLELINLIKDIFSGGLIREFSYYSFSTILYQASRVLVELAVARLLGPTLWGIWYLLNLIIAYRGIFELGVVNGLNREIPMSLGRNDGRDVLIKNVTLSSVILTTSLIGVLILFSSIFIRDVTIRGSLLLLIPLFASSQFFFLIQSCYKAYILFHRVSVQQILFSVTFPIITIPLAIFFDLYGFMIGYSISLTLSTGIVLILYPLKFRLEFNLPETRNLIRIGLPIMAVGIAYTFLNTIDRWFVSGFLSIKELGYYSMAILVFGIMVLFSRIISQQIYPRMAMDWSKTLSKLELLKWVSKQTRYVSFLIIPLFIGVVTLFPLIIIYFLPDYSPGINALRIIAIGTLFLPFSSGWGEVLNIIDKQIYYLIIIISAIFLNIGLNFIFIKLGYGIEGIALGTTITFGIYNISLMVISKKVLAAY